MIQKYDFVTGVVAASPPTTTVGSAVGDLFVLGLQTQFTLVNNQASAADVTGVVFSKTTYRAIYLQLTVYRSSSGGSTRTQSGIWILTTDGTNWYLTPMGQGNAPDTGDAGLTLTITSAGQLQYVSDDNGGVYNSANSWLKYKIMDLVAA
jgi:hypothetical protein